MRTIAIILMLFFAGNAVGQVGINNDGSAPDPSAMLEVKSSNTGFLPPRVADTSSVANPAEGLMIYDLSSHCMRYFNGTQWSECLGVYSGTGGNTNFSCGDQLTDSRDGKAYATVQIGNQCWMAENLNIGTRINGTSNQTNNGTIEKYCYNDLESNCDIYGGLYQWNEAMQYSTTPGAQGICPAGWHIPTDDEWKTLEITLGMNSWEADQTGGRGGDEGSKMASRADLWNDGALENGSNNFGSSGFDALPAGAKWNTNFINLHDRAYFWSSTESNGNPYTRELWYNDAGVYREHRAKNLGFSIRCVKD